MYPNLFGIDNFSYLLMIIIGVAVAFFLVAYFIKINKYSKSDIKNLLGCSCFAVAFGVVFAILFENLYVVIADPKNYTWTWAMTFYGGLFGGIFGFLLVYNLFVKKNSDLKIEPIVIVAPACITSAHAFGRIGCFLAGCCYGKETDSWIGLACSQDKPGVNVIPTQLIEAIFLFLLSAVLIYLAFKKRYKYTFVVYSVSYSIFRFVIEFFRDDPRGEFLKNLSPSQIWCAIIFMCTGVIILALNKFAFNQKLDEQK